MAIVGQTDQFRKHGSWYLAFRALHIVCEATNDPTDSGEKVMLPARKNRETTWRDH